MSDAYRRNVLELTLNAVTGEGPWGGDRKETGRLVIASLTWPRPMIAERISTKTYGFSTAGIDMVDRPWTDRIFFKEAVEGPFGLSVQVTEAMTAAEAIRIMAAIGEVMLRTAGAEAARVAAGPWAAAAGRFPFTHLAGLLSHVGKTPAIVAAGSVTLHPGRSGEIVVPLQVPEDVVRMRRTRSGGQTRTRREVQYRQGDAAGVARWTAEYYRG